MGLDSTLSKKGTDKDVVTWRQQWDIHHWFTALPTAIKVEREAIECANVSLEQLSELYGMIKASMSHPNKSFFKNTSLTMLYFTAKELERLRNNHKDGDEYFYSSSW